MFGFETLKWMCGVFLKFGGLHVLLFLKFGHFDV